MECNCYVKALSAETRFSLRYGAHNKACPVYRRSLDPVDREEDASFRLLHYCSSPPGVIPYQGKAKYKGTLSRDN